MQCHYEVLSVSQDADAATIKKAHRKLAIQYHPDKNLNDETAAEKFRLVQEAYECLSDVAERKWYDEHRDALLKGWSPNAAGGENGHDDMLFDVIPFMHAHCYTGYEDDNQQSFYAVYAHVFATIAKEEGNKELPWEFGTSTTDLREVANFYQAWEGFVSQQTFSWADQYNVQEAENRRVRRAMEEENKKARKTARKARNDDVLALVRFCKRRDPRMKALKAAHEQEKLQRQQQLAQQKRLQKHTHKQAREKWRQQAEEQMAQTEELDRLAGRVRLADLEDDYDYDYGGKKKKGKKKKGKKQQQQQQQDEEEGEASENNGTNPASEEGEHNSEEPIIKGGESPADDTVAQSDDVEQDETEEQLEEEYYSSSEEEEPEVWRCECCKKDFKSQGQMDNHMKSKKHKETYKKYQKKLEKEMMQS